jgi:hypothetical protein
VKLPTDVGEAKNYQGITILDNFICCIDMVAAFLEFMNIFKELLARKPQMKVGVGFVVNSNNLFSKNEKARIGSRKIIIKNKKNSKNQI